MDSNVGAAAVIMGQYVSWILKELFRNVLLSDVQCKSYCIRFWFKRLRLNEEISVFSNVVPMTN